MQNAKCKVQNANASKAKSKAKCKAKSKVKSKAKSKATRKMQKAKQNAKCKMQAQPPKAKSQAKIKAKCKMQNAKCKMQMQARGARERATQNNHPLATAFQPLISRTHARTHERNETISRLGQHKVLRPPNLRSKGLK